MAHRRCSIRNKKLDLSKNRILARLTRPELERLRRHLHFVSLDTGEVLFRPGDPVRYIYFPLDSAVSLLAVMEDGREVEVSLVGAEGVVGIWGALGADVHFYQAIIQIPGACVRIKPNLLRAELARRGQLRQGLDRYTRYVLLQIAQTAACNRLHRLEQRLARWLLMMHDHAKQDVFPATHEFLSNMLGAERSDVSLTAGILRKSGLIAYRRGATRILDRKGLESTACECYHVVNDELDVPG